MLRPLLLAAAALAVALAAARPALAEPLPLPESPGVHTRAITLSVGGAAGFAGVPRAFGKAGVDEPGYWFNASGSPAASFGWEVGSLRARFFADATTYPTYLYWVGSDVVSFDMVHLTVGGLFGSPAVRVGPEVFGGLLAAGGGVRAVVTPWMGRHGRRHGLDLRLDTLVAGGPSFRLAAMYTFTPWRRFGGEPPAP